MDYDHKNSKGNKFDFNQFKVISWDVDGTLYSANQLKKIIIYTFIKRSVQRFPRFITEWQEISEIRNFYSHIAKSRNDDLDHKICTKKFDRNKLLNLEKKWVGESLKTIPAKTSAVELLNQFKNLGKKQIILSDIKSLYKLQALQLDHFFDDIIAGEDFGHLKPSPKLFHYIINKYGIKPEELLHIGDQRTLDYKGVRSIGGNGLII